MAEDESTVILAVLALVSIGIGAGYFLQILSFTAVAISAVVVLLAYVLWSAWKRQVFQDVREAVEEQTGGSIGGRSQVDDLWNDLQDWASRDPRDSKLTWVMNETYIQTIPVESSDGEQYMCTSIITPVEDAAGKLHICVENSTGYVLAYRPTKFEQEEKKHPFRYVSFVEELRRLQYTSDEMIEVFRQNSVGQLPGGYDTPGMIDRSTVSHSSEQTGAEQSSERD